MSAEHDVIRGAARRDEIPQKTITDSSNDDDTFEDLADSADNSIIGKVKSRVSSIIPSSFSKWFSPSTRNNDSLNGSFTVGTARRRRRIESEEDDEYVDDGYINEDGAHSLSAYKENASSDKVDKDSDEDESDNSEDNSPKDQTLSTQRTHRLSRLSCVVNQPPSKRSRISYDSSNVNHHPLIASTPAGGISRRSINSHSTSLVEDALSKPYSSSYFPEPTACNQKNVDQPVPFDIISDRVTDGKTQENYATKKNAYDKKLDNIAVISSRRTLHLPSTSQAAKNRVLSMDFLGNQRQSIVDNKDINSLTVEYPSIKASESSIGEEVYGAHEEGPLFRQEKNVQLHAKSHHNYNGNTLSFVDTKKQKFNGTDDAEGSNADADSVSESSEGCIGNISEVPNNINVGQRKTGLFNMSNLNRQNGKKSRTSSFGNGINFYSHLEGRKSLFSSGANAGDSTNALNNSTLSLTSLNRRQFNASIYGSTSALSDSRLLNTFSPFYKGKTTYGGAAAYKKYSDTTGASRICSLTPTIIRPTSSLSTLSSSNNSVVANTGGANALTALGNNGSENTSAISSTAKRILDLINDFATPLSEAKKMANTNVKANTQLLTQAKSRLNESDLQASRAIRLSQVRTPYARPAVTLQPTIRNSNLPPPVRELQVPSMSQLLQMKKMQSTTERSRQIALQNSSRTTCVIVGGGEYTLPLANENNIGNKDDSETRQQQPHTNKIKAKGRNSARITASKNATSLEVGQSPPSVNLPNIAFPLMQSVPKFDITIPKQTATPTAANKPDSSTFNITAKSKSAVEEKPAIDTSKSSNISSNKTSFNFNTESKKSTADPSANTKDSNSNDWDNKSDASDKLNFKFSAPLTFACANADASHQNPTAVSKKYKFSPPTAVCAGDFGVNNSSPTQRKVQSGDSVAPQLKSGSVLDALKKPLAIPSVLKENVSNTKGTEENRGFGDEFMKTISNKWECQSCLIRNENNVDKCVACETPRTNSAPTPQIIDPVLATPIASGSSNFGTQFKKSSGEWDCDACMVRNKQQMNKCVACETPRKATPSTKLAENNGQQNSFGDAFKPKANTWECPTCLISNKSDCNECVACQTKNPASCHDDKTTCQTPITKNTSFKFGFSTVEGTSLSKPNAPPDIGFKSLAAAQMSAKWECDACMTRNDAARNKCVCCEQAKPGITTPEVPSNGPKFTFGTAASSKFTFGFGSSAKGSSSAGSTVVTTSVVPSNQKTEGENTKSFEFGSSTTTAASSGASSFSFGLKPAVVSTEKEITNTDSQDKDFADNGNSSKKELSEKKISAFKFGTPATLASKDVVTTNASVNFKFGVPSSVDSATTTSTEPTVKSGLAVANADVKDGSTKSTQPTKTTSSLSTTTGGFVFGNFASQPSTSGFSFGPSVITTAVETKTTTAKPFSFGVATSTPSPAQLSTTTASTATVKPLFSFGSNTTSTAAATSTSAPASTTITSTSVSAFTNSAGAFTFGSSIPANTTASQSVKPVFGSFTSATAAVAPSGVGSVPGSAISTLSSNNNVFGSFSGTPSSATTTTTSAILTLTSAATAEPPASNANLFGTLSQGAMLSASGESKPTASATMIFGNAGSKPSATGQATPAPFVFGSSASNPSTQGTVGTSSTSGNAVAPVTSWQKGGFTFGVSNVSATTSNTTKAPKAIFGSFAANAVSPASTATASPIATATGAGSGVFGGLDASNTASIATTTFGSVTANASTASPGTVFGASAATSSSATQSTQNLFGGVSGAPSAFGAPPSFGSGGSSTANNTPTFGAASSSTFGSFGAAASSTSSDGASAPKKSEPAFNFGGNTSQIASSGGGFNFGQQASTIPKPAFNFTASSAPTFNFTGSSSDQAAKPFQFGATPAPVFNFSGGAVEATPNAPFQFNAGSVPASSNIFAPTPSAPNAPGAMQARRKIRQPTRRLTPR